MNADEQGLTNMPTDGGRDPLDPPATATTDLPMATVEDLDDLPSDLVEKVVAVPEWGFSVRIKSLSAAAQAKVQQVGIDQRGQSMSVRFEAIQKEQFRAGVIEPRLSPERVNVLHHKSGAGFARVIRELDAISGTSKEDLHKVQEEFPDSDD